MGWIGGIFSWQLQNGSQDFDFFNRHGCRLLISCEIHCYFCPYIFWAYYFSLSQCVLCLKIPSFFLTFDLKYVQFQTVVSPSSIFVQHQGLFEAWNPLITFFGGLTAEISGCARCCVRDLKPGVLTDNRGVHRLDGNVLSVQLKTFNETLENKENLIKTEIFNMSSVNLFYFLLTFYPTFTFIKVLENTIKWQYISLLHYSILKYFWGATKGQLISKCPYEKSVWSKIATKIFPRFLFTTSRLLQNRVYLLANRT